jgi:outer membrane murein-binding lipoprotein Lpp
MSTTGYILIGLVIGACIGTGAGYYFIYPAMVDTKIDEFSQKLSSLESSINELTSDISTIQTQISSLQGFSNTVQSLSSTVSKLTSDLNTIRSDINSIQSELTQAQTRIEETKAYEILKKEVAKPGGYIADTLTDGLFDELKKSENKIVTWIAIVGQTAVKNALASLINAKMPSLVWNNYDVIKAGNNLYDVYIVTYFPIEIDTGLPLIGTISIAKINLVLKSTVNILYETVSSVKVLPITLT